MIQILRDNWRGFAAGMLLVPAAVAVLFVLIFAFVGPLAGCGVDAAPIVCSAVQLGGRDGAP